ncbi:MAG: amino acid ABC transporter substrate-binding protein [Clostridia bacterium]|nr:amino acid ABC transporter substrate-binding protein [Clostridia bacterium]
MKRMMIAVIVLVILATMAAGCADKYEETLIVGVTEDYPPMGFRNTAGDLVGFEVDLARAIAEEMGVDIELVVVDRQEMIGTLRDKDVDVLISSVSVTEEKKKYAYIDFSSPYLQNGHVIVTTTEQADTIKTLESLSGLVVGVEAGSTDDLLATEQKGKIDFTLIRYEKMAVCIAALKAGQLDCLICDMAVAIDTVAKNPSRFAVSSAHLADEPFAVAINIGNDKLLRQINDALLAVKESGKLSELSIEYMGKDYTQNLD